MACRFIYNGLYHLFMVTIDTTIGIEVFAYCFSHWGLVQYVARCRRCWLMQIACAATYIDISNLRAAEEELDCYNIWAQRFRKVDSQIVATDSRSQSFFNDLLHCCYLIDSQCHLSHQAANLWGLCLKWSNMGLLKKWGLGPKMFKV